MGLEGEGEVTDNWLENALIFSRMGTLRQNAMNYFLN